VRRPRGWILAMLGTAVVACVPADGPDSREADARDVMAVHDSLLAAQRSGDAAALGRLFTDDAVVLPDGPERTVVGDDSIRAWFERRSARGDVVRGTEPGAPLVADSLAAVLGLGGGAIVSADGRDTVPTADRYLMVLRRQPVGGWKIARLMWQEIDPG